MIYLIVYLITQLIFSFLRLRNGNAKYDFLGATLAFIFPLVLVSLITGVNGWFEFYKKDFGIGFNYITLFFCILVLIVDYILFIIFTKNRTKIL